MRATHQLRVRQYVLDQWKPGRRYAFSLTATTLMAQQKRRRDMKDTPRSLKGALHFGLKLKHYGPPSLIMFLTPEKKTALALLHVTFRRSHD